MMMHHPFLVINTLILLSMVIIMKVSSDVASDQAECTDQLVGLAPCLPYVQGNAGTPTPDCCTGFKQVTVKNIKCLCVLVKDKDDPALGLKINVALALNLPVKCDAPTNISNCNKLLNIPATSPLGKEFTDFENTIDGKGNSTTSTVKGSPTGSGSTGGSQVSGGRREMNSRVEIGAIVRIWSALLLPLLVLMG